MLKISIPTPCHEDWSKMDTNEQGRHCNSCMKTVVDFTNMSDEEVKNFLINKKQEHTCGRFKTTQLQRIEIELPQNIYYIQMPLWKRFLVACLVVFSTTLFSCEVKHKERLMDTHVMGGTMGSYYKDSTAISKHVPDTNYYGSVKVGGLVFIQSDSLLIVEPAIDTATVPVPFVNDTTQSHILMGDTIYEEVDSVILDTIPEAQIGKIQCNTKDSIPKDPLPKMIKGEMKFIPEPPKNSVQCEHFS